LADDEENKKRTRKRIKAGDPAAMCDMGSILRNEGDYDGAVKYWKKAAALGDLHSHYQLGCMHERGEGVEKDEEKEVYHYEKAAIGGHPDARYNLACIEEVNGNIERAVQHFIINANLGEEDSMKELWGYYARGNITKEDLEATLRSHKAAIDEMKSSQREEAERFRSF
jgi:TPR repeat protein